MEANTMNFDQSAPDLEAMQQLLMVFGGLVGVGGMKKGVDNSLIYMYHPFVSSACCFGLV